MEVDQLHIEAVELLKKLISVKSFSKEEKKAADIIFKFIEGKGLNPVRQDNNIIIKNSSYDKYLPTILLNSHIDTVNPVEGWTKDPFKAIEEDGKLYGLGSNDAGGALVSLLMTFLYLNEFDDLPYNLVFVASAEEEISGRYGIASIAKDWKKKIALGIIGEPTSMNMAVAEKGLVVLDCVASGKAGHAARDEGINAIYLALRDMTWFQNYIFPRKSNLLGDVKMTVTQVQAGYQHNVIPDTCSFIVDVRTNERYTNEELVMLIRKHTVCDIRPRSFRLASSSIPLNHPVVKKGESIGLRYFGSTTMSDQALLKFTTIKLGPGDSKRSHTADEFILIDQIKEGINTYIDLLQGLIL